MLPVVKLPVVYVAEEPLRVVIVATPALTCPINVVAVTTPVNLPSPPTSSLEVGDRLLIPKLPPAAILTTSVLLL